MVPAEMIPLTALDEWLLRQNGRIIHQVWFGTIPNAATAQRAYDKLEVHRVSWSEHNPTWARFEWNKDRSDWLVQTHYPEHLDLYRKYPYEIQRCDAIRYLILHRYGGLYADMDYHCNRPFDQVLQEYQKDLYLVQTPNRGGRYGSNSLMYSRPRHVFWKKLLLEMEQKQNKYDLLISKHLIVMYTTGPAILNNVFHRLRWRHALGLYPAKKFHPHGISSSITSLQAHPEVYAMHIGKGSWEASDSKVLLILYREWRPIVLIIIALVVPLVAYDLVRKMIARSIQASIK